MEAGVGISGKGKQRGEWSTEGARRKDKSQHESKASFTESPGWQKHGAWESQLCLKGQRLAYRRGNQQCHPPGLLLQKPTL